MPAAYIAGLRPTPTPPELRTAWPPTKRKGALLIERLRPHIAGVLSADIAVPQLEREVRFYSRVLGTGEKPLWREDLMNSLGIPIIGLGAKTPEYSELPVQWMPHIQVADVAASVERAGELGGRVLMHAKDDAGASQWAVLLDPNGAAFGIIPVVPSDALSEYRDRIELGGTRGLDPLARPDRPGRIGHSGLLRRGHRVGQRGCGDEGRRSALRGL